MANKWISMPLVSSGSDDPEYGAYPKYTVDGGTVIHHGDSAYVFLHDDPNNQELLDYPDVSVLDDVEIEELEDRLPYPLPSQIESGSRHVHRNDGITGLGDVVAGVTHSMGITECAGCNKRRRLLNRIPMRWPRRE